MKTYRKTYGIAVKVVPIVRKNDWSRKHHRASKAIVYTPEQIAFLNMSSNPQKVSV